MSLAGTLARCEERLNEVNDKYTFELCPEYRLKMGKTIGRATRVGMTYDAHARRYRVAVKHAVRGGKDEDEDEDEDENEDADGENDDEDEGPRTKFADLAVYT